MVEITLFKGERGVIDLDKVGRYITMHKRDKPNIWYDFDLKDGVFHRHRIYKTKDEEITVVPVENITGWFYLHKIITSNKKFAKMIMFNKHNHYLSNKFSNPARFIENLKDKNCTALEQWESHGIHIKEAEDLFERMLTNDEERDYYWGSMGWFSIHKHPQDLDAPVLKYIQHYAKRIGAIPVRMLNSLCQIEDGENLTIFSNIVSKCQVPRYHDLFMYERWGNTYNMLDEGVIDYTMRKIITCIHDYNLDLDRFLEYIEYLQHEYVDILWIADHYGDYLNAEYHLRGLKRKMDKYPRHLIYWHHIKTKEYAILKREIDEQQFKQQCADHADYAYSDKKYTIMIPTCTKDLKHEGASLNHCVGTYIDRVTQGKTFIVFLRRTKAVNESYVTVEIKDNALITAYAKENTKPDDDALNFLRKYAEKQELDLDWVWEK